MRKNVTVGLIGDYSRAVPAHQAIPLALQRAADSLRIEVGFEWVPTDEVTSVARISRFDGLWCVPASPYRSMDGALLAIRHARESAIPFLGTCGGFQHAVVEYARNFLGWADAEHAETAPTAVRAVISALECALVEVTGSVRLFPGTRIASAYAVNETTEGYQCRYGLNPEFQAALVAGPLRAAADDETGEVRAVELDGHPFFVATLFQPERAALKGQSAPLVASFVSACAT
jgi:CTP synthase (UTP-ammonia lyase)